MSMFWLGFITAVDIYLAVGLVVGIILVCTHLAYFFAAGWKLRAMFLCVGTNMIAWPTTVIELLEG